MSRALSPNGRVLRHPGDLQWLERRRVQAAELFAQGKTRAGVAGQLGVSAQTARHGKPPRLGPAELARIRRVGSIRTRRDPDLLRRFLAGTGLTI